MVFIIAPLWEGVIIQFPDLTWWNHDGEVWSCSKTDSHYFHSTCYPLFHFEVVWEFLISYTAVAAIENQEVNRYLAIINSYKAVIILWLRFWREVESWPKLAASISSYVVEHCCWPSPGSWLSLKFVTIRQRHFADCFL